MERPHKIQKEILPYIEYLEAKLKKYENSPYKNSYLALLHQIESWNSQLQNSPIDLFGEATEKAFERAHKFFIEQKPYFEQLDYLRKLMSPGEIKDSDERKSLDGASAERFIFKKDE